MNRPKLSRRDVLSIGGTGLAGLSLPGLLAADSSARSRGVNVRADACITIFLNGGASHHDTWDMKPDAPSEIRGEFRSIPSSLPEVPVCEHLPRLAHHMHRTTVVRSMHHSVNNAHAAAVYAALTGHDRGELGGGARPTDYPPPGAVLGMLQPPIRAALPYVVLPFKTKEGARGPLQPGFLAGFIGRHYDPFWILNDPNAPEFSVPNLTAADGVSEERIRARRRLLAHLGDASRLREGALTERWDPSLESMDEFQQRAFDLLTSGAAQRAFRLSEEPEKKRELYGRNIYGQSVLLARRLIEAGTRLVNVSWAPDANATWDTHTKNFVKLKSTLLPQLDAALSTLLSDLEERSLLERTLVAVLGDFGRTPRVNKNAGRDHWNSCYTILLAGGGIRSGFVYGASDRIGALPIESPTTPGDIVATIYHLFGIDHRDSIYDAVDRPHPLVPHGRVVRELLA